MLLVALSSAIVSLLTQPLLILLLRRAAVLDRPKERSSHAIPTPRGGGLGIALGVLVGVLVAGDRLDGTAEMVWSTLGVAIALGCVGLLDDLTGLPAVPRLLSQLAAGGVLGLALSWPAWQLATSMLVLALWVTLVTNAFNFMDGVNGISAFNAVVSGTVFAMVGTAYDAPVLTVIGVATAGAAAGFLPWNLRGTIFLGDVGSYFLGGLLAGAAWLAVLAGAPVYLAAAPLSVYLADVLSTLGGRVVRHEPLLVAHRDHVYQRLLGLGWSHLQSAGWSAGAAGLVSALAGWAVHGPTTVALLLAALVLFGYLATPAVASALGRTSERTD